MKYWDDLHYGELVALCRANHVGEALPSSIIQELHLDLKPVLSRGDWKAIEHFVRQEIEMIQDARRKRELEMNRIRVERAYASEETLRLSKGGVMPKREPVRKRIRRR